MVNNYLKLAFRNIRKNKVYSFINIFGLAIGLTSFILIALYIFDELTADRFHKHADNIYRVIEQKTSAEGKESKVASVAYNVSAQAKSVLPELEMTTRFGMLGRVNIANEVNTNVFYESFYVADAPFLQVFDFKLLEGDRLTALKDPRSVIVTEETAKKFFGSTSVLGQSLSMEGDSLPYKITGVMQDIPVNSHIQFNVLFSESSLSPAFFESMNKDWSSNNFVTYYLLKEGTNLNNATAKLNQLVASHREASKPGKSNFYLQSLKDIHFYSEGIEGNFGGGNITYIYVFSILALFVLVIACINYINLTTARFSNRAKEIAVRKVAGAFKKQLVSQFLSEAFLVTLISFGIAFISVKLLLPSFNTFVEKELSLGVETDYRIWISLAFIILLVTLLSGIYPAFFQSRLKPIALLKTKLETGKNSLSIRKALVVFQFTLSIVMIVATIVVYMQLKYINTKNLGFNKEQLVIVDINSGAVRRGAETIKQEYGKLASVKDVTVTSRVPGEWKVLPKVKVTTADKSTGGNDMYFIGADDRFLSAFQVQLIKGRNFNPSPSDSASVLLNETAALQLGITEPSEQLVTIPS
ncbi:MAG TPA: ABC transporter permease, partial [Segetibacter sp.]